MLNVSSNLSKNKGDKWVKLGFNILKIYIYI